MTLLEVERLLVVAGGARALKLFHHVCEVVTQLGCPGTGGAGGTGCIDGLWASISAEFLDLTRDLAVAPSWAICAGGLAW